MTKRTDDLNEILAELRQEHREITAPESLEARLRAATRAVQSAAPSRSPRLNLLNWQWGMGLAAAVLLGIGLLLWGVNRSSHPPVQQAQSDTKPNLTPDNSTPETATHPADTNPAEGRNLATVTEPHTEHKRRPEVATAFMEVPGSEGLPTPVESSIVRVRMAKSDLRQYGFDVPPAAANEMIHADLYLGEDGLPRAIRLMR